MRKDQSTNKLVITAWIAVCSTLVLAAICLVMFGDRFGWVRKLEDIPALWLTGGTIAAGLIFVLLMPLTNYTLRETKSGHRTILVIVLATGFVMRAVMIPATPALEDDFYRYLWDGAVTATGASPYVVSPATARTDAAPPAIRQLAQRGTPVLDRVNHPALKTIYPPVAQAAFAAAFMIEPWSLRAWRLVCLFGEIASVTLLLLLLGMVGRSPLWVSLYWLNPLVVKELLNSAHMEAILLPFVLGTLVLLALRRPVMASATLGLAIGAKIWPVMLLPLVLRPMLGKPAQLITALVILSLMAAAWLLPPILGGLNGESGFVAYASYWQTNSALFQLLQSAMKTLVDPLELARETPGMIVRLALAAVVAGTAVWLARDEPTDTASLMQRAAIIVVLMFLLSPAQFPWYASWALIFAPFFPLAGLLSLTVFLPLYYVSFHLFAIDAYHSVNVWVVRVEWLLIAAAFLWDAHRKWRQPLTVDLSRGDFRGERT